MARDWVHWNKNKTVTLPIDEMMIGQVRTRASDSYVADSASAATAYSCGIKTYNGAIGVDNNAEPCGTVLEAAKLEGYKTGLIVTSRITHVCQFSVYLTDNSYSNTTFDRLLLHAMLPTSTIVTLRPTLPSKKLVSLTRLAPLSISLWVVESASSLPKAPLPLVVRMTSMFWRSRSSVDTPSLMTGQLLIRNLSCHTSDSSLRVGWPFICWNITLSNTKYRSYGL